MKIWDAAKAKLYSEVMNWASSFFSLSEDATEAEVHAAMSETSGTLTEIREAAMAAATEAVSAQLEDFKAQLAINTQAIADTKELLQTKDEEIKTLTDQITELQTGSDSKDADILKMKEAHVLETKSLQGEISKLKAGKPLEGDHSTETVSGTLGNGGGGQAGAVIKNSALRSFLKKSDN